MGARRRLTRSAAAIVATTALLGIGVMQLAASASAGTLVAWGRYVGPPVTGHYVKDVMFFARAGENNDVTVASAHAAVIVREPNRVMTAYCCALFNEGLLYPPPYGPWVIVYNECMAPTGRGFGICTPGADVRTHSYGPRCCDNPVYAEVHLLLGDGNDRVTLGPLRHSANVAAGSGDDVVDARNGAWDQIYCADGNDTVYADAADKVWSDCETVIRS
jgi:hypothetical protein